MSGSPSLAATRSARRRRLHPLRHTESDRDLAYLIRTLLRFSAQQERGSARRLHRRQPVARSQDLVQSAPAVPAAGRRRWIRCTPRREGYKLSANYVAGDSWRARLASVQRSVRAGPTESTVARIAVITPVTPSASFAGQDQHYGDPAAGLVT